jgi:hypothetical protein
MTVEAEVVARLARGDTQTKIASDLNINPSTVGKIKDRQSSAISTISAKVAQRKMRITSRILEKAHRQLEQRLDESDNYDEIIKDIQAEYEESDKTDADKEILKHKLSKLKKLSVLELINITKEAFHQSQVEQGKPTSLSYSADPKTTKEQLDQLLEAIESKNGERLIELTGNNDINGSV